MKIIEIDNTGRFQFLETVVCTGLNEFYGIIILEHLRDVNDYYEYRLDEE
jgi:hypothetical protein